MAPITSLPNEILAKIFGYLPPPSLHSVAVVCPHWLHLAKTLGVCRLDLYLFAYEQQTDEKRTIAQIKKEIPTEADGAGIRHILILSHRLLPDNVFCFIQRRCPNVISFDYDHDFLGIFTNTEKRRHHMQQHSFLSSGWRRSIAHLPPCHDGRQVWSDDIAFCQRLESLHVGDDSILLERIKNGYFRICLPYLPHLTVLTLHKPATKFREWIFSVIHRDCPRLVNLTVQGASFACVFGRGGSSHKMHILPTLQVLKLDNIAFLHQKAIYFFHSMYPNIQTLLLSINYAHQVLDKKRVCEGIFAFVVGFKRLGKLVVHLNGFGTDDHPVDRSSLRKMQVYFSRPSHIHTDFEVTYS